MDQKGVILVVDHPSQAREAIRDTLDSERVGEVVFAESAEQALDILGLGPNPASRQVDLVLTDVDLPGQNGIQLCRQIRNHQSLEDLPVIMLTSLDSRQLLAKAFAAGASDFITKPPGRFELLARVRLALALKREMKRRKQRERELMELTSRLVAVNQQMRRQKETLDKDLEAAAGIQRSLLPTDPGECVGYRVCWSFMPSQKVGGDIFNLYKLAPDMVGFYMVDVTGHGVTAALFTVSVHQRLLPHAGLVLRDGEPADPREVLMSLDHEFPLDQFEKGFTIVYGLLNTETGQMVYSNAGHPRPLLIHADGRLKELTAGGTVIGLGGEVPFEQGRADLKPGDRVFLYTDGLTEIAGPGGEFFGAQRLKHNLARGCKLFLPECMADLEQTLVDFGKGREPDDDVSLMLVEYLGPGVCG